MPSLGVANRQPPKAEGERKSKRKMVSSPARSPRRQPSPSETPPKEKKERAAGTDDAVSPKPARRKPSAEALCTAATQFPLLISAAQGNLPMVQLLAPGCAAKCQLEQTSEDGFTPFMAACALGHADVVRFLLTLDVNVECLDHMGRTPFMAACGRGHLAVVKLLSRRAVDVERKNMHGGTALMFAAAHGHLPVVKFLHALGSSLDEEDDHGYTALMLAAHRGHDSIVQFLAAFGAARATRRADVYALARANGRTQLLAWLEASAHWRTPLHFAPWLGADRVLKLLRGGADVRAARAAASLDAAAADAATDAKAAPPAEGEAAATPVEIAQRHEADGACAIAAEDYGQHKHGREACRLVLLAAQPWSRDNHECFPRCTRRRVRELQLIGRQLSRAPVNAPHAGAFWELFNSRVLQYAVSRGDS